MCSRTGWPWDYVWDLGVDRIEQLEEHWRQEPPVDVLVAHFLGFKPPKKEPPRVEVEGETGSSSPRAPVDNRLTAQAVEELKQMFPGGIIR